jgi:AraC-like DNA-binding protein
MQSIMHSPRSADKELLGQTPLEYVTEWRMQKAMQLLQQRDKKLIESLGRSVTIPTLHSVRRSSELSGLTLVNISNVVIKTEAMSEWRKIFEVEDSDFGGGSGHHGSVFFR